METVRRRSLPNRPAASAAAAGSAMAPTSAAVSRPVAATPEAAATQGAVYGPKCQYGCRTAVSRAVPAHWRLNLQGSEGVSATKNPLQKLNNCSSGCLVHLATMQLHTNAITLQPPIASN